MHLNDQTEDDGGCDIDITVMLDFPLLLRMLFTERASSICHFRCSHSSTHRLKDLLAGHLGIAYLCL